MTMIPNSKFIQLDALRGIACIVVLVHHFCLAFLPNIKSSYPDGIQKTPFYLMINGNAAVILFFVLSGFVLSIKCFGGSVTQHNIYGSAIKRLPRLYLPSAITIFIGYFVFTYMPKFYVDAGLETNSEWLLSFGGGTQNLEQVFTLKGALFSSILLFFKNGEAQLNTSLWTMKPELIGSLMIFAFLGLYVKLKSYPAFWFMLCAATCFWAVGDGQTYVLAFFIGLALAYFYPQFNTALPSFAIYIILGLIVLLLRKDNFYQNTGAATLLIYLFISDNAISKFFTGNFSKMLGRFSFPLYLTHMLVICSISSYVFTILQNHFVIAVIFAFLTTIVFSTISAIPFVLLDEWWVKFLNRATKRLFRRPQNPQSNIQAI